LCCCCADRVERSLDAIKNNIQLIHPLLNLRTEQAVLMRSELIEPLTDIIYHRIEQFLDCLKTVLLGSLDMMYIKSRGDFNLQQAWNLLQSNRNLTKQKHQELEGLIHDIHYILQMKQLERDFFSNPIPSTSSKAALSDIVPITGLILSRLHRVENEHKTVLDHWAGRIR
jgi:hypothetical protein